METKPNENAIIVLQQLGNPTAGAAFRVEPVGNTVYITHTAFLPTITSSLYGEKRSWYTGKIRECFWLFKLQIYNILNKVYYTNTHTFQFTASMLTIGLCIYSAIWMRATSHRRKCCDKRFFVDCICTICTNRDRGKYAITTYYSVYSYSLVKLVLLFQSLTLMH